MSLADTFKRVLTDPHPEYVFEISEAGLAHYRPGAGGQLGFEPLEPGVLVVSPLRDNVQRPEILAQKVQALTGAARSKRGRTVLILPDFAARVSVLEFDSFPKEPHEQSQLIKFRLKKAVPFDVEHAAISFHPQQSANGSKKLEVAVVTCALEIVARYEAPFRSAGLHPGLVTTSSIATLELDRQPGVSVLAKLSGNALTVSVLHSGVLKLVRSVELSGTTTDEVMNVLFPTVAFAEDQLAVKPSHILLCGFGAIGEQHGDIWEQELGVKVELLKSRRGTPGPYNAGLMGYLEGMEARA